MSRRPTDWAPLAGSDPVPGDPDEIERAAKSLADMAEEITRQTANLRKLATAEGGWDADAGRTFADSAGELSGQLGKAHGRYATAAGALRGYAPQLRHAQSVADGALADAKQAQVTVDAHRPPDHPPAGQPTPAEVTAERQRQYAYEEGVDALHAARRKLTEATDHRDEHAGRAARTIRDSIDHDGLEDSWWDKFTNWVSEHADLLRAIARIAELVATVLSAIALVIAFIPFLNVLTPVLLGLAALASAVALVCTLMLALAGEASWADVGLALLSVATVGLGKVAGLAVRAGRAGRAAEGTAGGARALSATERTALDYATRAEKLDHVFVPKHNLDPLVKQFGSREAVMEQMLRNLGGPLPKSGPFQITREIGGQNVVIRGAVVDGVPKIGTAFTP